MLKCDNQSAIYFSENRIKNNRTKHIDVKHHFVRDCVEKNWFTLKFVPTNDNLGNIFTKLLPRRKVIYFGLRMRLI